MVPIRFFPIAAVALLWVAPGVLAEHPPTSKNDPFRIFALCAAHGPAPPVCSLQPPTSRDPLEDEVLVSFEEWKRRQLQEGDRAKGLINHSVQSSSGTGSGSDTSGLQNQSVTPEANGIEDASENIDELPKSLTETMPPHFRIPLVDRFNYASSECSARVHLAHRSAKSSSSILSFKRDRYMLSPCDSKEQHFVIVELCEDIMIDTVQLANFEFFSGVFKDFKVSVAKTYDSESWTSAGVYRAKNVRGVQSFHPPTSLRDFYRYIRIDFLSHYGNEFYCPVSLLRVYGLTHLEQFKWDIWEAESRAKISKENAPSPPSVSTELPVSRNISEAPGRGSRGEISPASSLSTDSSVEAIETMNDLLHDAASSAKCSGAIALPSSAPLTATGLMTSKGSAATPGSESSTRTTSSPSPASSAPFAPIATPTSASTASNISNFSSAPPSQAGNSSSPRTISPPAEAATSLSVKDASTVTASPSSAVSAATVPHPIVPPVSGGESIYRTIMNRLTALEANHTLYTRYVEQQNNGVREILKGLAEDVGRLEGITRGHVQGYQRKVREWEQQQRQLHMEYNELVTRVEYLSDEIILEKRIGIAQLCLLMIVLIFMGLTRGSRTEHVPGSNSVREWGRRHLSLSGDWRSRFTSRGRSTSTDRPVPLAAPLSSSTRPNSVSFKHDGAKLEFPSKLFARSPKRVPLGLADMNIRHDTHPSFKSQPRSRTPSLRGRQNHHRPVTPTSSLHQPQPVRSGSHVAFATLTKTLSGSGTGPRSAKKWGHVAHLHEVRKVHRNDKATFSVGRENDAVQAMSSPSPAAWHGNKEEDTDDVFGPNFAQKAVDNDGMRPEKHGANVEEVEGDQWVDTDLEGSEGGGDWDLPGQNVGLHGTNIER